MALATYMRFFIIFQGTVAIGLAGMTLFYYVKVFVQGKGILPAHVAAISISHIMLMLFALNEIRLRLHTGLFTWRIPFLATAFLLSDLALYILTRFEYNRYKSRQEIIDGLR